MPFYSDDKLIKITRQLCNGFVIYSGKSGELPYITFFRADMPILGL